MDRRFGSGKFILFALPLAALLGGCAADEIEFNGGIFNAIGLNNKTRSEDPKVAARSPLVMPPNAERLPTPGEQPNSMSSEVAALQDPEEMEKVSESELKRQQTEYCAKHYDLAKARGDSNLEEISGPLGPCRQSVLTSMKNWNKGESE